MSIHTPTDFARPWRRKALWLAQALLLVFAALAWAQSPAPTAPPKTRVESVTDVLHGVEVVDPYRWLEDQKSPETRAWIDAQNAYTRSVLDPLPGRDALRQRISELLKVDTVGTPWQRNGAYFFSKRLASQDLSVIYLRKGRAGKDKVLIDPHPLSPDRSLSVSILEVSDDGGLLAYGVRRGGEDEVEIRILDVKTGKDLPDRLPRARQGDVSLKRDKSGFFYSKYGSEGDRVYYHALGTDPARDVEIFGKGYGLDKNIACQLSEDGRYLLLFVGHGSTSERSEVHYLDVANQGPVVTLVKHLDARFLPDIGGDTIFLHTNWNAPNGRVLAVDLKNPARDHWREVVPESDAVIRGVSLAGGRLFVTYTHNASSRVKVFEPGGKLVREVALPAIGNVGGVSGRWGLREAFYSFSSFHIPTIIYRYDVAKGTQDVWARLNVPISGDQFEVKQVWYESKDKTRVPMFVVHKKGLKLDGSHPALLTGYGGFNISQLPNYASRTVVWVERGGVYAIANLRGGSEFGEAWHRAGMLEKKQNVFDDFIAAGEWLVQNGYTKPSRLAISGGSNGGLLVGAALTQRPELFGAVLCSYPLLDMVRYHRFSIARFWVPEYGSAENPEQFQYIHAYSPYHRVQPGAKYPAVMVITGDSDTRVDPLHGRKMAALLQASTGSDRPILLHYDTKAGHIGGSQPVGRQIENLTDELSFLFWQLGVRQ